jgi:hypothetical protein
MRMRGNGFWEIFVPGIGVGEKYKYEIVGPDGRPVTLKADPVAFAAEPRPKTASIVVDLDTFARPQPAPPGINGLYAPISIYEVHLGSWSSSWRRRQLAQLRRARRSAPDLRARHGVYSRRIPSGERASLRWVVGLPTNGFICSDQPVGPSGGLYKADRCLPPGSARGATRLGAGPFSR